MGWVFGGSGVQQIAFEPCYAVLDCIVPDITADLDAEPANEFRRDAKLRREIVAVLGLKGAAELLASTAFQILRAFDQSVALRQLEANVTLIAF